MLVKFYDIFLFQQFCHKMRIFNPYIKTDHDGMEFNNKKIPISSNGSRGRIQIRRRLTVAIYYECHK